MPPAEIEKLLESKHHEMRVGAVSIMDWKARAKKTSEVEHKALFDLYIRRHDLIDSWDLVDRSAPYVVGGYLAGKPRKILYKLARSANPQNAAPPSSAPISSSGRMISTIPSPSPKSW